MCGQVSNIKVIRECIDRIKIKKVSNKKVSENNQIESRELELIISGLRAQTD